MKSRFAKILICLLIVFSMMFSTSCDKGEENNNSEEEKKVYYNVVFDSNGGTEVKAQRVEKGKTAEKPSNPTKKDSTFVDWYRLGKPYDFATPVTENISLTAKWYNSNIKYRVTVGVDGYFGNRGSAVIEGQNVSSVNFSEGNTVTLKAIANEGYSFVAWMDYYTGEVVSQDATHTFIVTEDVTLEATFNRTVSGLENPANLVLWNSLSTMGDLNSASFEVSVELRGEEVNKNEKYELSFNKQEGVLILMTPNGTEKAMLEGEQITYYVNEGDGFVLNQEPDVIMENLTSIVLTSEQADAEQTEQTLLAIYQLFKDSVTITDTGLDVSVDLKPTLEDMRDFITENSSTTVKKYIYDVVKPEFDKVVNTGKLPIGDILDEFTIEELLSMIATEGTAPEGMEFITIEELDTLVEKILDDFSEELTTNGFTFDKTEAFDLYEQFKASSIKDAFEMLNDSNSKGNSQDVPNHSDLSLAVFYAVYNNFTIEEIAKTIVNCLYLNGTQYDITDTNNSFENAIFNGQIVIENGMITYAECDMQSGSESVNTKISFSFTKEWSDNN